MGIETWRGGVLGEENRWVLKRIIKKGEAEGWGYMQASRRGREGVTKIEEIYSWIWCGYGMDSQVFFLLLSCLNEMQERIGCFEGKKR